MKTQSKKTISVTLILFLLFLPISFAIQENQFIGQYNPEYDDNGNLVKDEQYYYEYDSFNQLTRIRAGSSSGEILVEYFYDQDGERIKKVVYSDEGAVTTYYIDSNFVRVVDSSGTSDEVYYYANGDLVGKKESNGEIKYYHPDHLGSTNLVTNENSDVIEETKYKPFGEVLFGGESRFGFTGQEKDKETNLMYYGARYYSPFLRRFTQPDTIIQDIYDPQSLNRYAYARNNPLMYKDDSGHLWHIPLGALIGGVIGAGASMISQILNGASMFDGSMDWGAVGKSAIAGATFGGVAAATFGIGPAVAGTGYGGFALGGAISGFTGGRSSHIVSNLQAKKSWNKDLLNVKDIALETGLGAVFGLGGKAISNVLRPNNVNLHSGKVQEIPIKDLYGTHTLHRGSVITPEKIAQGRLKGPIEVYNYRGRLTINDGMGRTARSALVDGKSTVTGRIMNPDPNDIAHWDYARYLWKGKRYKLDILIENMKK